MAAKYGLVHSIAEGEISFVKQVPMPSCPPPENSTTRDELGHPHPLVMRSCQRGATTLAFQNLEKTYHHHFDPQIQDDHCHAQDWKMTREEGEGVEDNDSSSPLRLSLDWCICHSTFLLLGLRSLFGLSWFVNLDRAPGRDRQQQSWFFPVTLRPPVGWVSCGADDGSTAVSSSTGSSSSPG